MDINSANHEYRVNPMKHPQIPLERKVAQDRSEPGDQAGKQAIPGDQSALPEGSLNTSTSTTEQTIAKALAASALPMSERNRTLVRELLHHQLPVDKQTLQMFARLAAVNRNASPLTLVLMYKNQIPITSANLRQFEAYQSGNHQLLTDLQSLTKHIMELLKSPQEPGVPVGAVSSEGLVPGETPVTGGSAAPGAGIEGSAPSAQEHSIPGKGGESPVTPPGPPASSQGAQTGPINRLGTNRSDAGASLPSGLNELSLDFTRPDAISDSGATTGPLGSVTPLIESFPGNTGSPASQATTGIPPTTQSLPNELGSLAIGSSPGAEEAAGILAEAAQGIDLPIQKLLQRAVPFPEDPGAGKQFSDLLPWLTDTLASSPEAGASADTSSLLQKLTGENGLLKHLTRPLSEGSTPELSDEFLKHLEGLLRQKWTLTPEQLTQKNSLKELYQRLEEDLHRLDGLLRFHRDTEEGQASKEPVKNLQDNLQFMKALNQLFSYVQLPLRFRDREIHGEFYVFNKKNALPHKKDILSVLLHLDMTELGAINIHMKLNKNQIQATFSVEHTEAGAIIKDHLPELTAALTRKGYQLQARVEKQAHPQELLKELLEQEPSVNSYQTFSFDTKA